jgi:hypothetical protein
VRVRVRVSFCASASTCASGGATPVVFERSRRSWFGLGSGLGLGLGLVLVLGLGLGLVLVLGLGLGLGLVFERPRRTSRSSSRVGAVTALPKGSVSSGEAFFVCLPVAEKYATVESPARPRNPLRAISLVASPPALDRSLLLTCFLTTRWPPMFGGRYWSGPPPRW